MTVVFRESTRKMTPKNKILVLVVIIGWLEGITGAAFSNVVVQRSDVVPVEYFNYDPSSFVFTNPQIAQLSTSPLETVIPAEPALASPCLAPCLIPSTAGSRLAPISSKIITFKAPVPNVNVPVVVANKEAPRGYQYAYAVYDDQTGDKKSQSEHSDGSVVQGQYSFVQPDGVRREVVYTADDLKGFNAVVRNISPEPEEPKEAKVEEAKINPAPCPEPQNERLTEIKIPTNNSEEIQPEVKELEDHKGEEEVKEREEKIDEPKEKEKEKPLEGEVNQAVEVENSVPVTSNVNSYNDIIKCLQSKLQRISGSFSPLTYVIIPSLSGPC